MKRPTRLIIFISLLLGTNLLLLTALPLVWRAIGVLILTIGIPGYLLTELLVSRKERSLHCLEQAVLAVGVGLGVQIITMLLLSYLPGGLTKLQTLLTFNGLNILFFALLLSQAKKARANRIPHPFTPSALHHVNKNWLILALVTLILIASLLRLTNLGYSEFQGDEVRAVLRAAAVIQGHEDVLFLHRKGPTEILVPTTFYVLTGQMTEWMGRLPFALANIAGLVALFLLGVRLFGPTMGAAAGWVAAMLLALDGYFIAFARIVQYQSIVFLMSVLVVWVLVYLVRREERDTESTEDAQRAQRETENSLGEKQEKLSVLGWSVLAAFLLGIGLLSHYEAGLVAIPGAYLIWCLGRSGVGWGATGRGLVAAALMAGAVVGVFYVPFFLHPNFSDTFRYLSQSRVGGEFPYNNLADFWQRTTLYSTTVYLGLLAILTVAGLPILLRRAPTKESASADELRWLLPLWFGGPFVLAMFVTADPRTHVYTSFLGAALLAGAAATVGWRWLGNRAGRRFASAVGVSVAVLLIAYFGHYAARYYVENSPERLRIWPAARLPGYPTTYAQPSEQGIFGFPLRNGWKTVAALYDEGLLDGAFQTNAKPHVANWYIRSGWNRAAPNCFRDHRYYFFVDDHNIHQNEEFATLRERLRNEYAFFGSVMVNGEDRLEIYEKATGEAGQEAQQWDHALWAERFDRKLSGLDFEVEEPVVSATLLSAQQRVDYRFGDQMRLVGYSISPAPGTRSVQAGSSVSVTLYWEVADGLSEIGDDYFVFNQIIEPETNRKVGQRDGQPACDLRPTSSWTPGELIVDRYTVPLFADAAAGNYPLLIGVYDRESNDRLPITTADGQFVGESLTLAEIWIE